MIFTKLFLATFFVSLLACNNPTVSKKMETVTFKDTSGIEASPATSVEECYKSEIGKSVVQLSLIIHGDQVEGTLNYLPDEKDKNTGRIVGHLLGDTLLADYTFMSEGIESVREVTFLLTDKGYKEGYAPMIDQNGKMIFEDLHKADYSTSALLVKVDCK